MTRVFEGASGDDEQFRLLLDEEYEWPSAYTFKFIVPAQRLDALLGYLDGGEITTRPSSKGTYISVTYSPVMDSSESVIALYKQVSSIEGVVSL